MNLADAGRLAALGAIWGSSFLLIKVGLESFDPLEMVAVRVSIAAVVLRLLLWGRGNRLPRGASVWGHLAVMAVVSNLVPFTLIFWGEEHISSGLASILNSTTPLFTALLATAFLASERLTVLRAAGILLGFLGVGVIVGIGNAAGSVWGQLAVVAAAASYGVGFVYSRHRLAGGAHSPVALSAAQLLIAAVVSVPVAFALSDGVRSPEMVPIVSVIALGALGTGVAYVIYYRLVADVGATTASFVTYLIPVFGVVLGAIFLSERLGWSALGGTALVVAGIALAERGARRPTREPAAAPGEPDSVRI